MSYQFVNRKRAPQPPRSGGARLCVTCNRPFAPMTPTHVACSSACARAHVASLAELLAGRKPTQEDQA